MKFEYVILLILAFNVVAALVKKRKAEAARLPPKAPKAPPPPDPRREVGRARDAYGEPSGAARAPDAPETPREKKSGLGRDLMEQLAKELGLETGEPERPRPEVVYRDAGPEVAAPEVVAVVPPATTRAPRRITAPLAPVAPAGPAVASRNAPALELRDREGLRRAFIAKEVLGPPVSRRAPGRV